MRALSDYFSAISEIAVAIDESEVDRWEERSQNFVEAKSQLEDSQDALSEHLAKLNDVDLTGLPTASGTDTAPTTGTSGESRGGSRSCWRWCRG